MATRRSDRETVVTLRLPKELHERLQKAGGEGRGLTAQIRDRLEASFSDAPPAARDPLFDDVLAALGHAASGASRMYPDDDAAKFDAFMAAAIVLMLAYKPEGRPSKISSTDAGVLAGLALGALGDRGLGPFAKLRVMLAHDDATLRGLVGDKQ
jgi:hypothetical protein